MLSVTGVVGSAVFIGDVAAATFFNELDREEDFSLVSLICGADTGHIVNYLLI